MRIVGLADFIVVSLGLQCRCAINSRGLGMVGFVGDIGFFFKPQDSTLTR